VVVAVKRDYKGQCDSNPEQMEHKSGMKPVQLASTRGATGRLRRA